MHMADEQTDRWPRFKLVTYSQPTGIPHGWDEELLELGAPDGLVVEAIPTLTLLEDPDVGPLVCFGIVNSEMYICLDPRSNHVVDIVVSKPVETDSSSANVIGSACLVNSTLGHFIAAVQTATARFPFDSEGAREDRGGAPTEDKWVRAERLENERFQAAEDLVASLRQIDPASVADPDGFWMTFVADV
jgi:hypothetical protein